MKGRSTVSNLAIHTSNVVNTIKKKLQYDSVYTDFKKAFDLVNHSILINKLINFKIPNYIINWVIDYLKDRFTSVKIHNCLSDPFKVPCGVPQGSHIGPILFVIFINDLVKEVKFANCQLFADDCKLSYQIKSTDDCYKLQSDLNNVSHWCKRNNMIISIPKCYVISFTRSNEFINFDYTIEDQSLSRVTEVKDLGVIFDYRLTFKSHLENIISRANRNWFFICRHTLDFKDGNSLKILYYSLVRSVLTYASTIWRPIFKFEMYRLEIIQHKALRRIAFLDGSPMNRFSHDYSRIALKYNIPSLTSFFEATDSLLVYKIMSSTNSNNTLKNLLPINSSNYVTRFQLPFYPQILRNVFSMKDPVVRLCILGNNMALFKPFLVQWNVTINTATNIINSIFLNYC